jgi:hydroxymethylbilane synthase
MSKLIRIATRKSPLALWQAQHIRTQLLDLWPEYSIELIPMVTSGDRFLKDRLQILGGKGLFVKELEEALLDNRADLAVHSMKDVPATCPDGLSIPAICTRDNPFDAFVSLSYLKFRDLPVGASIGTTSLRRQSQLLAIRPDLLISPLRGNIHTRLAKLDAQDFDAIVLAASGLERMSLETRITEVFDENLMLPACGQGALGIECRKEDIVMQQLIAPLNDPLSALCIGTERHVNALLGGNCHVPLAVYCTTKDSQLYLRAKVATADGSSIIYNSQNGSIDDAMQLSEQCVNALISQGAEKLLAI